MTPAREVADRGCVIAGATTVGLIFIDPARPLRPDTDRRQRKRVGRRPRGRQPRPETQYVLEVSGKVASRQAGTRNAKLATGDVEVQAARSRS